MSSIPKFAPVPTLTRRDQVAETLRRAILSGQVAPGTQLIESRLAADLAVSRGLLREAIRELIESGLAVNRPYAGTFVAEVNASVLRDVYEMRRVMERQAYIRIWPQRDQSFRTELQHRFDQMIEAVKGDDLSEEIRAEAHFHGLVYERCGNHLMPAFWQQMTQKTQLGFAICQIAHAPKVDFEENHHKFLECALGESLEEMLAELDAHLDRGLATIQFETESPMSSGAVALASSESVIPLKHH
ncbi:GntR family transcriptional regulator [Variovorax sp. WS11]|uniref:GntR family transcriptional regulator n=1 Tax=Variovorax sp. WS11 TaxID=1105204 RepID=UPI000D0E0D37|nr:GntR family transcriptional regulator [Variovorax sp. WS11]NDZ14799.1 GntR family transcriptional regulator [Variovorax sp. WS11]PSL85680.1 GntR family transcriptional regulator [Variovorax sp. WS11]